MYKYFGPHTTRRPSQYLDPAAKITKPAIHEIQQAELMSKLSSPNTAAAAPDESFKRPTALFVSAPRLLPRNDHILTGILIRNLIVGPTGAFSPQDFGHPRKRCQRTSFS